MITGDNTLLPEINQAGAPAGDPRLLCAYHRYRSHYLRATSATTDDAIAAAMEGLDGELLLAAEIPARTQVDLAIKVYLLLHAECGGQRDAPLLVALPEPAFVPDSLLRSILGDCSAQMQKVNSF